MPDEEAVKAVLKKPPGSRNDKDCQVLQRATSRVKFFKSLEYAQHLELCRVMTTQLCKADQHVFDQGDTGSTFYVIYKGGARVFVNDGKLSSGFGQCVVTLEDGDSFGELALLGNGTRAATVVMTSTSQLLLIEKDAYDASLQRLHIVQHEQRVIFLRGVFLFSDWEDEDLAALAKVLTSKRYEKNSTIIRQGRSTDQMYFIVEGRCRVLKRMGLSNDLHDKLASARSLAGPANLLGDTTSSFGSSSPSRSSFRRSAADDPMLEIGELTPMQYFGERGLLEGEHKGAHTASIVSASRVELLILSKYDFAKHIDQRTQDLMHQYIDKFYFDEDKIRRTISKQHRWESYKSKQLQDAVTTRGEGSPTRA